MSETTSSVDPHEVTRTPQSPPSEDPDSGSLLENLQTEEQRRLLDIVVQIRKCGLNGALSLPQLVVCGDQSAGKSSVLEALTGIPFPRSDNLCTRFATEISLRCSDIASLTIKVNPDESRPADEKEMISSFERWINNFDELPRVMADAMAVMGMSKSNLHNSQPFARDVLSIEICGPSSPQLTVVDIPGLIATSTKGITFSDVNMVAEITDYYIQQPRTICLAVVSALNDYANQKILELVREVDPDGERTLGIITKPDGLPANSGSEEAYIELAQNKDVYFKLGWHVLKNRKFEEAFYTLEERRASEAAFFRSSNWKILPQEFVGIDSLRQRLSVLLYEHIQKELPQLREDLEDKLEEAEQELAQLGRRRSSPADCKAYLAELSLDFYEICKSAINGHYEGGYFQKEIDPDFSMKSPSTLCRTRAVIQMLNTKFADTMRLTGHKYQIQMSDTGEDSQGTKLAKDRFQPIVLTKKEGLDWVREGLMRTRGKELVGNFNPLLIGELFWEQSSKWGKVAAAHVDEVANICSRFLKQLLQDKCQRDVANRIWSSGIEDVLKSRHRAATKELEMIVQDLANYPINYNHYYTDTIRKLRQQRHNEALQKAISDASTAIEDVTIKDGQAKVNIGKAISNYSKAIDPNMDDFSCEEALDCLIAIYKVTQKNFIANVAVQVIERHIIRDIEKIFSPVAVTSLEPEQAEALASEPAATKRTRDRLEEQIRSLRAGHEILKTVM